MAQKMNVYSLFIWQLKYIGSVYKEALNKLVTR